MATVRYTILAFPALDECEEYLEKVVLPNRSLDGAVEYTPSKDMKSVNLAAADMYAMIGNNPDFTENKLSVTWSSVDFLKTYRQNGEPEKAEELQPKKRPIRLTGRAKYTS